MPELPEVEIAARSLAPQVIGRSITGIAKLDWERMIDTPSPAVFRELIVGRRFEAVGRRAKWLLCSLDAGWTLAFHLRMSGNLTVQESSIEPNIHTHLVLGLNDGRRLFFEDQRKFGRVMLLDPAGLAELDARFGPEPLAAGFTPEELCRRLANRRTKIKPLLLDQQVVAGLGNIYVSEALWLAKIHPERIAAEVSAEECRHLQSAIVSVLTRAIANQGSTLRNYRNSYGENGRNQEHFSVYARAGEPCERCATPISRTVIAQRSSFFCEQCQS